MDVAGDGSVVVGMLDDIINQRRGAVPPVFLLAVIVVMVILALLVRVLGAMVASQGGWG